jgi:hypothetical protein
MRLQKFQRVLIPITLITSFVGAQKYVAFGDSFAAGIGAGAPVSSINGGFCRRTEGAYAQVLYKALGNTGLIPENQFFACSGATTQVISGNDQGGTFMDDTVDIATISLGLVYFPHLRILY